MNQTFSKTIFQHRIWVVVFALTIAVAWGWAFPLLKLGFDEFGIMADMTGSKILFAGIRFTIAGLIVLIIAAISGNSFKVSSPRGWLYVIGFALFNTSLHYTFFYIGISNSPGARAAILNSLGTFLLVLLACAVFKSDRLTRQKIAGCLIGFMGILILNVGGGESGRFSMSGDGMIIINTICTATAGLMTRSVSRQVNIFVGTGYSLAIGGALLIIAGLVFGGSLPVITLRGLTLLSVLITISAMCFAIYNKLLSCNPVGKIAIFNSLIPIVGAITSCMCLGEPFYWKYIVSATLAAMGIYIINKGKG